MGVVANMSHSFYDIEPRDSLVKPKPLARSSILVESMRVLRAVASWKTKELLNTESSQYKCNRIMNSDIDMGDFSLLQ